MWSIKQSLTLSMAFAVIGFAGDAAAKKRPHAVEASAESAGSGIFWLDPADIESRNLFYGSGGEKRAPNGATMTYQQEDMNGSNPKLVVNDSGGVKWKLKLGPEARPETTATRLVWAAGFFTTDNYLVPELHIEELPQHLHRGQSLIGEGGVVHNARLKRNPAGYEKAGVWKWKDEPSSDMRAYNGLRVMMALLNNWDLKDDNNEILERKKAKESDKESVKESAKESDRPERLFIVSDLGDSFGTVGLGFNHNQRKGKLELYQHSKFIVKTTPEYVNFSIPARPGLIILFNPREYFSRVHEEWIGRRIPRSRREMDGRLAGAAVRCSNSRRLSRGRLLDCGNRWLRSGCGSSH